MNTNAKASSSKVTAKVSRKASRSQKAGRPKADEGLSESERILVHALRAAFLPKGKGVDKSVPSESNPFVSRKASGKKSDGKGPMLPSKEMRRRKKQSRASKSSNPKMSRRAPEAKAALVSVKKPKSPSKVRRAAKRSASRLNPGVVLEDGRVVAATREFPQGLPDGMTICSITKSKPISVPKVQRASISGITPKEGVAELDVVLAFGGASALEMLRNVTNGPQEKFKSCTPLRLGEYAPKNPSHHAFRLKADEDKFIGGRYLGISAYWREVKRDYTVAARGQNRQTEKLSMMFKSGVKPIVTLKKEKAKADAPKSDGVKKVRPSHKRRLAARLERRKVAIADSVRAVIPEVVKPSLVEAGPAERVNVLKELLNKKFDEICDRGFVESYLGEKKRSGKIIRDALSSLNFAAREFGWREPSGSSSVSG